MPPTSQLDNATLHCRAALAIGITTLALGLALSACGESAEDKAQKTVCSARADIKEQVDELKGLTVTTASLDGVQSNLRAIGGGLERIVGAQDELNGDRKQEVQQASQAFKSEVTDIGRQLVASASLSDGQQRIQTALRGLASNYEAALAPIDCS